MGGPRRILTLQVLRGIAANFVVLSHVMAAEHRHLGGLLPDALIGGFAGVDLFFALSGFVMVLVADRTPGRFLLDRATRIYPAYWAVSLVVLAAWMAAPGMVNTSVVGDVSIVKSFLLFPQYTQPLLAVGWTLIHEVYFYVVFALVLALRLPLLPTLLGWGALAIAARPWASAPLAGVITSPMTLEFVAGACAALAYRAPRSRAGAGFGLPALIAGLAGFAAGLVAAVQLHVFESAAIEWYRTALFAIPAALIVYGLATLEVGGVRCPKLLVAAGDWSYSTYLLHVLVVVAVARLLAAAHVPAAFAAILLVLVGVGIANSAGAVSYRLIERPSLRLVRNAFRPLPAAE